MGKMQATGFTPLCVSLTLKKRLHELKGKQSYSKFIETLIDQKEREGDTNPSLSKSDINPVSQKELISNGKK